MLGVQFTYLLLENHLIISPGCCDLVLIFFDHLMIIRIIGGFLCRHPLLIGDYYYMTRIFSRHNFLTWSVDGPSPWTTSKC